MIEDAFWEGMGENFFVIIKTLLNSSLVFSLQRFAGILLIICICVAIFKGKNIRELREKYFNNIIMAVICAIVLWISVLQFTKVETFIYGAF